MKKGTVFLVLIAVVVFVLPTFAGEDIGQVGSIGQQKITLPVVHDTTMRTVEDLSAREIRFIDSVPKEGGLRNAVTEMVLAGVVHVPEWGIYLRGDSVHYWSIYQAWTGPAKVTIPLIEGPRGPRGYMGPQGPMGPPGPSGQQLMISVAAIQQPMNALTNGPQPYSQIIVPGAQPMWGGFSYSPTDIKLSAYGGAGGSNYVNIRNANNNANSNANTIADTDVINIGDGSACGSSSASGSGSATSGN